MGFLSYNRKFIYSLIDKQRKKFHWTEGCQRSFEEIKKRISEGIVLTIPQVDDPQQSYTVNVDSSQDGYGGELTQVQHGVRRTLAYFSKKVPDTGDNVHRDDITHESVTADSLTLPLL